MNTKVEDQQGMNRREFMVVSCGATLALLVNASMMGVPEVQAGENFIQSTCGQNGKLHKRILIAYASRCGSTGTIAQAMGEALCAMGATVDVRLVRKVKDLSPYQAVIVGSAVRRGKWLSEATNFVEDNQDALSRVPVAYFVACLTMKEDTPENRQKVMAYLDPVREDAPKIRPVAVGLFAGAVDFDKLSFFTRTILRAKGIAEGDYRDFAAVKGWSSQVGPKLLAMPPLG